MRITKKKLREWQKIKDDIEDDIEHVTYEVKVPNEIVDFLEALNVDVQSWLQQAVIDHFRVNLDIFLTDPTTFLKEKFKNIPQIANSLIK